VSRLEPAPLSSLLRQLDLLQEAFPAYQFRLTSAWGRWRFDVRRVDGRPGLYAVITTDPRELWHELADNGRGPP
jgi:hypothetical protein